MIDEPVKFETEADLCEAFVAHARSFGWTVYAETQGYDLVLVDGDGNQVGVHAKLRFNLKVLEQVLDAWEESGPDFRAILVPLLDWSDQKMCDRLGLVGFHAGRWKPIRFYPSLALDPHGAQKWHYWNPDRRLKLPAYVPDVSAGVPGPRQLTEWKIKALKLQAIIELRGWVTRATFRELYLDHRMWTGPDGCLKADPEFAGRWIAKPDEPLRYAKEHPVVYPQVLEDVRKWLQLPASL